MEFNGILFFILRSFCAAHCSKFIDFCVLKRLVSSSFSLSIKFVEDFSGFSVDWYDVLFIIVKSIVCIENCPLSCSLWKISHSFPHIFPLAHSDSLQFLDHCLAEWTSCTHFKCIAFGNGRGWSGVHHMHICTQINGENNDLIKVFMTFRYDDEMKNVKLSRRKKKLCIKIRWCTERRALEHDTTLYSSLFFI